MFGSSTDCTAIKAFAARIVREYEGLPEGAVDHSDQRWAWAMYEQACWMAVACDACAVLIAMSGTKHVCNACEVNDADNGTKAQPPLGVAVNEIVRCTEVYGTSYPNEGKLLGYAIDFSGKTDAYGRAANGSLIHFGTFPRHEDALETVYRYV